MTEKKQRTIVVWAKTTGKDWYELETKAPIHSLEEAIKLVKTLPEGTEYRIFTLLKFGTVKNEVTTKVII